MRKIRRRVLPRRRVLRTVKATAAAKPDVDDRVRDMALQYLAQRLSELPNRAERDEEVRRIGRAARRVRLSKREALVASNADGNYRRLGLPVDDKIAGALVEDRLAALDDRRHLIMKSGAGGAAIGAVITGALTVLVWWLQQGGTGN